MLERCKITALQTTMLMMSAILPTAIIYLPSLIYREATRDAWASVILVTVFGLVVAAIVTGLGLRFPDMTIIQYSELLAGKVVGKAIGLVFIAFFIFINAVILREFTEMYTIMFMPNTPALVFSIGIVVTSAYIVRGGVEVLARVNEIVLPTAVALSLAIVVLASNNMKLSNLAPMFENGFLPAFRGAYVAALFFAETVFMLMLIPYLERPSEARLAVRRGIILVGVLQLVAVVAVEAAFGARCARLQFPTVTLTRLVSIRDILERLEPFVMYIWVAGGAVKVGIFLYCSALAASQWLNLRDYRVAVLPIGAVLVVIATVLWRSVNQLIDFISRVMPPYFLAIEVGLPLALLVLALVRGKGAGKR
jgi:spore germination protein KB